MNFPVIALVALLAAVPAWAEIHHVAPPTTPAADHADGSATAPWPSVDAALTSGRVVGGDEIRLASGEYGDLVLNGARFETPVLIRAESAGLAHVTSLDVARSQGLVIEGLAVWPLGPGRGPLVTVAPTAARIVLKGLDVRSREDAAGYPGWSLAQWHAAQRGGVMLRGPDDVLLDSRLTGLSFAISATGPRARIAGNVVAGFSGDGMRALGDGSVVEGNRIQDCVHIDDNHADAFQSWSLGPDRRPGTGDVRGLVLRSNVLLEWASPQASPLRCSLQGIGLFDGTFSDLVIENNLIVVTAYHGIAVAGGHGVRIINNTLVNSDGPGRDRPWIAVTPHKHGEPSTDVLVANNLVPRLMLGQVDRAELREAANLVAPYPTQVLEAPYAGRFGPLTGGPAVDAADPLWAPPEDLTGQPRGAHPDIGAIEAPGP